MSFYPRPEPTDLQDGQESVWDYPRPPAFEKFGETIEILYDGDHLVTSNKSIKIMETASPPTYYFPVEDIKMDSLKMIRGKSSYCEWKGRAVYYSLVEGSQRNITVAWSYPNPNPEFEQIKDHLAFYPHNLDCRIENEKVKGQKGEFYGGWITSNVVGPFKGEPGTEHW